MIDSNVELIEITENNITELNNSYIVAFTFAYAGAMGDREIIKIISKSNDVKVYKTNWNIVDGVIEKVEFFKPFMQELEKHGYEYLPAIDGWSEIDMGMGNVLFIKSRYLAEFEKYQESEYSKVNCQPTAYCFKVIPLLKWFFEEIL